MRTEIIIECSPCGKNPDGDFAIYVRKWWWLRYKFRIRLNSFEDCYEWIGMNIKSRYNIDIVDV